MDGWDKLREKRYQKLLQYGIINKNTKLSPRGEHVPAWETLTQEEKVHWDDKMAVYSAMIDRMDQNIGRLRQTLKDLGEDKNTVIMFLSDNGASNESIKGPGFLPSILEASK